MEAELGFCKDREDEKRGGDLDFSLLDTADGDPRSTALEANTIGDLDEQTGLMYNNSRL